MISISPKALDSKAYFINLPHLEGDGHTLVKFHPGNADFRDARLALEQKKYASNAMQANILLPLAHIALE